MEKVTLVSLLPHTSEENKPGLYPGTFTIPAAEKGDISVVHLSNGVSNVYLDSARGSLSIPVMADKLVESVIKDYSIAQLGQDVGAQPGLFYVEGHLSKQEVKEKYPSEIRKAEQSQRRWFERLVELADDLWQRYHRRQAIGDVQRNAARYLGLEREWLIEVPDDSIKTELKSCQFCTQQIPISAIKCLHCHEVVNPEEYKKMVNVQVVNK